MDSIRWECSKRRHMGCPFQIFTSLPENRGSHQSSVDEKAPSAHLLCREADPLDAQVPAEAGIKDAR